jgi:Fe-S cluster assembly ATP-binding protein
MLEIKDLHASINGKEILKGINLTVKEGEVHAIMGPNGSGKSTLSNVLVGHPAYEVTKGSVTFGGKDLLALSPEDRSHEGLFLSFQYPVEIPGVSMVEEGNHDQLMEQKGIYYQFYETANALK